MFKFLGIDVKDKDTEGVQEESIWLATNKSNCHKLLYLFVKLKPGMEYCMINNGATSNFISLECAKLNAKKVFEDLTLRIELREASKLLLNPWA